MFFKKKYKVETGLPFCFWINTKEQDISKLKQRPYKNMYSRKRYLFEEFIYSNMDDFNDSLLSVVVQKDDYLEDVYFYRIERKKIVENYKLESKEELIEHVNELQSGFGYNLKHFNCHIEKESIVCKIDKKEHLSQSLDDFMKRFTKLRSNMDRYLKVMSTVLIVLIIIGTVAYIKDNKEGIIKGLFSGSNKKTVSINHEKIEKKQEEMRVHQESNYFKNIEWMGQKYRVRSQNGLIFSIVADKPDSRVLLEYIGKGSKWISHTKFKTSNEGAEILKILIQDSLKKNNN